MEHPAFSLEGHSGPPVAPPPPPQTSSNESMKKISTDEGFGSLRKRIRRGTRGPGGMLNQQVILLVEKVANNGTSKVPKRSTVVKSKSAATKFGSIEHALLLHDAKWQLDSGGPCETDAGELVGRLCDPRKIAAEFAQFQALARDHSSEDVRALAAEVKRRREGRDTAPRKAKVADLVAELIIRVVRYQTHKIPRRSDVAKRKNKEPALAAHDERWAISEFTNGASTCGTSEKFRMVDAGEFVYRMCNSDGWYKKEFAEFQLQAAGHSSENVIQLLELVSARRRGESQRGMILPVRPSTFPQQITLEQQLLPPGVLSHAVGGSTGGNNEGSIPAPPPQSEE